MLAAKVIALKELLIEKGIFNQTQIGNRFD